MFAGYFDIFSWASPPASSIGTDIGCGSGRWAFLVAPRVGHPSLVDPSEDALAVAGRNMASAMNVSFHHASVDASPFKEVSLDFAYSLGVLHHVPDTASAIFSIAQVLNPGAPFLIDLYYAFDQRSWWFRALWRASNAIRGCVCRMPIRLKNIVCEAIALIVYLPLARTGLLLDRLGMLPDAWPLANYRKRKYYVMRTDALNRFGARLDQRFSREQIESVLRTAGFSDIRFSDAQPLWCAVGVKK